MPISIHDYFNNLSNVTSIDTLIGLKDGVNTKVPTENSFRIPIQPIVNSIPALIGYLCPVPVDNDIYGLIIDFDDTYWYAIVFGVVMAKVANTVEPGEVLYQAESDIPDMYQLTKNSEVHVGTYPLAIALEPPTNGFAKVFFFGGISYSMYGMVSDMINAALNP